MDWIQTLILALVQGVTEFLPISSSGHLLVLQDLFTALGSTLKGDTLTWTIALHFGTLISILVVFWKRIRSLLTSDRRVIPLVIVATIPAVMAVAGLKILSKKFLGNEDMLDDYLLKNSLVAGFCFPITGLILLYCSDKSGGTLCRELSWKSALGIGLVQAIAILPGISRSGSTICAGLLCRLRRDEAATFSFLMAIPAIGGGALLEIVKLLKEMKNGTTSFGSSHDLLLLGVGTVLSCVAGILALMLLINWLQQGKLKYFAYWLFLLGPVVIVWQVWLVFFV